MTKLDIYESFNARYLSFEDIAKTFIGNSQFEQLLSNNHTLLMGPRGSGKTTLLKMLTPLSQYYYSQHNDAVKWDVQFVAIYIPSDVQWKRQIEIFKKDSSFPNSIIDNFPRFLVTNNILICLLNTFEQLININSDFIPNEEILNQEANLCTQLINSWAIEKPIIPTVDSIKQALFRRLQFGNTLLKKIRYESNFRLEQLPDYFYQDYFDLILMGCTIFEGVFKKYKDAKWALCFDELEISPDWLQYELIQKFRSIDQRFIFKLTTSPLVSIVDKLSKKTVEIEAREEEDYRVVRTWNHNLKGEKDWNLFGEKLLTQKFQRFFANSRKPIDVFGEDSETRNLSKIFTRLKIQERQTLSSSPYAQGNQYYALFKELARIDESFRYFLVHKQINPLNPVPESSEQLDQIFRKILQIALFRLAFKKANAQARGRKNPGLYYGLPTIYELCDGNPRFLIGLADSILQMLGENSYKAKIGIQQQSATIHEFSKKYLDLISSHPDSNREIYPNKFLNLGTLIKEIGSYFASKMLKESFKMDVFSTFTIDDNVPEKIVELIELGIHLGALIYLEPKMVVTSEGLKNKKFRLSYLLHPYFNLPIREYKHVKLSVILTKGKKEKISEQLTFSLS